MEHLDYSNILEKLGKDKNFSVLTEEERLFYDIVRAVKYASSTEEKYKISQAISTSKQIAQETTSNTKTAHPIPFILFNKTWMRIAAGIAILILAYFLFQNKGNKRDEIFTGYFKKETSYLPLAIGNLEQYSLIDPNTGSRDSLLAGLKFYENLQFENAIKILSAYTGQYPKDHTSRFYLALSHMHLNQFDMAMPHFSNLQEVDQLQFAEDIKWYYILCLLKSENGNEKAKVLLEKLKSEPGKYQKQATEVFQII